MWKTLIILNNKTHRSPRGQPLILPILPVVMGFILRLSSLPTCYPHHHFPLPPPIPVHRTQQRLKPYLLLCAHALRCFPLSLSSPSPYIISFGLCSALLFELVDDQPSRLARRCLSLTDILTHLYHPFLSFVIGEFVRGSHGKAATATDNLCFYPPP